MKNTSLKKITISAIALLSFSSINAQNAPFLKFGGTASQDTSAAKMSLSVRLTKTPWIIQFGPDLVDDNDTRLKEFKVFDKRNYYPVHASAEKRIKGKWSLQAVLSTESLNPHSFWSTDLNTKYSFNTTSIRDKKWFDPYGVLGLGHTYRDFPHGQHRDSGKDNSLNANIGGGVNLWCFENAGIYLQSIAKLDLFKSKWGGSNYLQFSLGIAFKIGSDIAVTKVDEAVVVPGNYHKSKEAEDAAEYLRQILNK